jgi:23S rRNA (cytosine1962-C5)-methyltransferase
LLVSLAAELHRRLGFAPRGWLVRELARDAREQQAARLVEGEKPGVVEVCEWGVKYAVEPAGGYSTGLFLDQRMNRRRVLDLRPGRTLNLFAYTCSFSVCAARRGGETLSVDVAKRALARGRENFARNAVDTEAGSHRLVADDAAKVVPRLVRRGERFDLIVLDPPTFGRAEGRVFRLERDLPDLVRGCFALLEPGGAMLVSCNFAAWSVAKLKGVCQTVLEEGRFALTPGESVPEIPGGAISCWVQPV